MMVPAIRSPPMTGAGNVEAVIDSSKVRLHFTSMEELDETAERILAAASARFMHYGYRKTTMSEIADDCNMSPGNLYRYFAAKLDIAEAFGNRVRLDQFTRLKEIVEQTDLAPAAKLRAFLQLELELVYERVHAKPKTYELSRSLFEERPEFAAKWKRAEADLLRSILEEGAARCVFGVSDDLDQLAHTIQTATTQFATTHLAYLGEIEELRRDLDQVVDLILDGLAWRAHQARAARGDRAV